MKKHFVTFYSPGTFVHEETTLDIGSYDVDKAVEMSKGIIARYNAKPFAFRFSTKERGENDLDSKTVDMSGLYFLGGRIMSLEEVKREMPDENILISNMECNGWDNIIVNDNSWRTIKPFTDEDVLLNV